jgi:hypothetical protein
MKKTCSGLRRAELVSHTMKPLNAGASTHRWARVTLRGLTVALLVGCRSFSDLARGREERERREKGAHNGATVAHRRLDARFYHCGAVKRKRKEENER